MKVKNEKLICVNVPMKWEKKIKILLKTKLFVITLSCK